MAERNKDRKTQQNKVEEPPPWIRYSAWILNWKNWRKHWKAILIVAVIAVIIFAPKLENYTPPKPSTPLPSVPHDLLSEEQARKAISAALHQGEVTRAMELLSAMNEGAAKREESERIFDFCIKNALLPEAGQIANQYFQGNAKRKKLSTIERERLKYKPQE